MNGWEDEAYRYFAVDLDGVLCEDLPPALYHADLEACLLERDSLPLSAFAPSLMPSRHVVVTARPSEDSERTRLWLDKQGYHAISVHLRDPSSHSVSESAIHKGETATRLGCSDFIESDPRQAIEIAARFPHLRVTYWNEGNPILVSANQSKA